MNSQTRTLKIRIKDKHSRALADFAFCVNQVWNEVNSITADFGYVPIPEVGYVKIHFSAFDLQKSMKEYRHQRGLNIPAATVQEVIAEHAKARRQFKKDKLRWRLSGGSRRSLGWIPFKSGQIKYVNGQIRFAGVCFGLWDSYGLSQYDLRAGSFSQDARGCWYINIAVKIAIPASAGVGEVGIDLGLTTTATCSDDTVFDRQNNYRHLESKLATAQRARNKKRVKTIHAKIKNRRADAIHKFTTHLVDNHQLIVVGDVSSAKLAKTKMAKSVLDAGWYMLKTQLKYKAIARSVAYLEVNEAYSTQTCSSCGSLPDSRPRGIAGLGIREWRCSDCGAQHDRDINAAKNILAAGHCRLAVGIPAL